MNVVTAIITKEVDGLLLQVRVLATLDHPNIVTYYDRLGGHSLIIIIRINPHHSFERDGVLMIEMEYADGGNLAESLARKTIR